MTKSNIKESEIIQSEENIKIALKATSLAQRHLDDVVGPKLERAVAFR